MSTPTGSPGGGRPDLHGITDIVRAFGARSLRGG